MLKNGFTGNYPVSSACLAVLRLSNIKGLGLKSFHLLYDYFSSAEKVLHASYEELIQSGIKIKLALKILETNKLVDNLLDPNFDRLFEWASTEYNYVICLEDTIYPASLREIFCPPPLLYLQGQLDAFDLISIGVVGSRRPTLSGQLQAKEFSRQLAQMNICVTSGLAIGVDTIAHQGALGVGGVSCAVLGSGLDRIYPRQNRKLAMQLQEQGVLVSELALDVAALPANFPRRNRIISGLSKGILVVEAGLKSGSLITANFAIEQNREVFAVPGSIDNPLAKGCHALIKQGAYLVENADDILSMLGTDLSIFNNTKAATLQPEKDFSHLNADEQKVISVLGNQSTSFDDLLHCLGMDVTQLNTLLVMLELKGELSAIAGGYQRL
jgi:DNA processing protein